MWMERVMEEGHHWAVWLGGILWMAIRKGWDAFCTLCTTGFKLTSG